MPFPAQQSRGWIEPDPTGAGEIDLGPGVQVGKVLRRTGRTVERLEVGLELDQVAGDEARCQAELAQDLHEQPGGVTARSGFVAERLFHRLHARLHADQVADLVLQPLIELDQKVDGIAFLARDRGEERGQQRPCRFEREIGRKVVAQFNVVAERKFVGVGLDEKIERIDHLHRGEEIHRHGKLGGLLGKDETGDPVAVRILLPVHEVLLGRHLERIAQHPRAAMRRRTQSHHVGPETDRPVVLVACDVMETRKNCH